MKVSTCLYSYRFERFELQPSERRLLAAGVPAVVDPRAFDVLIALVERAGHLVTKEELFSMVWPKVVVEENNLQVQISALRKILGPAAIATVSGQGYRFTLEVSREVMDAAPPAIAAKSHLPRLITSFTGSGRELADVKKLLGDARLLTLVGVDGIGKTRLLLQVAADVMGEYPDGVWFVDLAPSRDARLVPQAVASVLGVKEEAVRPVVEALLRYVKDRRLLLILDNCDHLTHACTELAEGLLQSSPHLKLLVSSCEQLHVAGESIYPIPALTNIVLPTRSFREGLGAMSNAPVQVARRYPLAHLRRWQWIAGGVVALGLAGITLWTLPQFWKTVSGQKPSTAAFTADAGPLSIVVLPFTNLTGDANQAYVADGLTASLTADLSRIRDAFIVNTATAFAYKDKPVTAQQVGKDLGVHFLLQGSVQRSGTKIRINAQLADATSNAQLWSESFDGDQSDLFALQDQVTARIGNSIGREIVIVAARESETRKSSPKAADLMLRARALDLKPQSLNNLQQQEDLYRQALALEPNNASAMVGLAVSLVLQPGNFYAQMDESIKERKYTEGHDVALKAKELDPDNPRVYTPIAVYAGNHGDWDGFRRAEETRLSLDPRNPSAYNNVALTALVMGEPKRAIELLTKAINLNPKHPHEFVLFQMGYAYFMLGDNDAAIEWLQKSLEVNPGYGLTIAYLAMAYALRGEDAKARDTAADLRRVDPKRTLSAYRKEIAVEPAAFQEWFESKLIPAWRKAGLPE